MRQTLWLLALVTSSALASPSPTATISTHDDRTITFGVEIADTARERERGLQHRRELADDRGMVLVYPCQSQHKLWMKNTRIPLDMVFIGRDLRVVGIVERAEPLSLESRSVGTPSRYVLEINGGAAGRHGLRPGDAVRFEGFSVETEARGC